MRRRPIDFNLAARAGAAHVAFLTRMIPRAAHLLPRPLLSLSVALVGDRTMSSLHLNFLDVAGPTDVLTFELEHDARGRVTAGEIVVCVPEARRQARRQGTIVQHELLLYAVHGMLHLTGYDDRNDAAYTRMHAAEDRILEQLGVGAVFHPAESGDALPPVRLDGSHVAGRRPKKVARL